MIDPILVALRIGFPFDLLVKATLVLAAASGVALVLSRSSAATRHMVWCVAVSGLLLLPLLALVLPAWEVPVGTAPATVAMDSYVSSGVVFEPPAADGPVIDSRSAAASFSTEQQAAPVDVSDVAATDNVAGSMDWMTLLFVVWSLGTLLLLARLAVGWVGIRRLGRAAQRVDDPEWQQLLKDVRWMLDVDREVTLVRSDRASMPMTWGTRRPTILIPAEADFWSLERRRVVLLHEMAHVARRDCLTQTVADVACALYWFHPLTWIAATRLRSERERACDDRVLAAGERASDYAGHLLEVARAYRSQGSFSAAAIAMARPSQLEGRLLAVLDGARRRAAPGRRELMVALAVAMFILIPLAAVRAVEAQMQENGDASFLSQLQSVVAGSASMLQDATAGRADAMSEDAVVDTVIDLGLRAAPGGTVRLDLESGGTLRVIGWDRDSVALHAELRESRAGNTSVSLDRENGVITFATDRAVQRGSNNHRFELRIHSRSNVELTSGGGDVRIESVAGEFTGSTGGGNIRLHSLAGTASMRTGGGNIDVTNSQLDGEVTTGGGDVTVVNNRGSLRGRSGGGNVRIDNSPTAGPLTASAGEVTRIHTGGGDIELGVLPGGADLSTGGGDISVAGANGRLIARTGGGDISIRRVVGAVDAQTGGGDVALGSVAGPAVVRTGGGDIEIALAPGAGERDVDLMSGSGTITLDLPADFSGQYEIIIESRDDPADRLESEIPLTREIRQNGRNTVLRATGRTGTGTHRVIIRNSSGEVRIRRGGRAANFEVRAPVPVQRVSNEAAGAHAAELALEHVISASIHAAFDEKAIERWATDLARVTIDTTIESLEHTAAALEAMSRRGELDPDEVEDLRELQEGLREYRSGRFDSHLPN